MEDCHTNGLDLIEIAKLLKRAQAVELHLWIILSLDAMALAILKVDHVENRLGDNHAVTGTKAARHILREVETSLEDNHCVGTSLLRLGEAASHELRVGDRALTHFRIVIAVRLELGFDLIFIGDLVKLTEEVARCELCESVRNRSLFGVSAG